MIGTTDDPIDKETKFKAVHRIPVSSSGPLKEINEQMAGTNCPIIHVELSMLNLPDKAFINLISIYKYNQ